MSFWWISFNIFVLAMLALDLGVFHRKAHVVKMREAQWRKIMDVNLDGVFHVGQEAARRMVAAAREAALVSLQAEIAKANQTQNWERKCRHALMALWLGDPQPPSDRPQQRPERAAHAADHAVDELPRARGLELLLRDEIRIRLAHARRRRLGSRARGDVYERSDWDLAYLAEPEFDPEGFRVEVTHHLRTDDVDLVDLDRAGGVLRFQVASEAKVLFEADPDVFPDFWFRAVSFWCDARPILEAGHRDVLDRIADKVGR